MYSTILCIQNHRTLLRFVCFQFANLSTQLKSGAVPSIDHRGRGLRRWRHDFVQPQESIGKVFEMSQARKPSLNSHSYSVLIDNLKQIPDGCSGRARQPWNPNSSRGTSAIAMEWTASRTAGQYRCQTRGEVAVRGRPDRFKHRQPTSRSRSEGIHTNLYQAYNMYKGLASLGGPNEYKYLSGLLELTLNLLRINAAYESDKVTANQRLRRQSNRASRRRSTNTT